VRPASLLAAALVALGLKGVAPVMARPATASPALICRLHVPAESVAGTPLMLQMTLTNTGTQAMRVLTWNTPFEGAWWGPSVQVWRKGRELPYRGPSAKRAAPAADEYVSLPAGASREASLDLALPFDLEAAGRYELRPQFVLHDVQLAGASSAAEPQRVELACPVLQFSRAKKVG
jgi:hypothetical protein